MKPGFERKEKKKKKEEKQTNSNNKFESEWDNSAKKCLSQNINVLAQIKATENMVFEREASTNLAAGSTTGSTYNKSTSLTLK